MNKKKDIAFFVFKKTNGMNLWAKLVLTYNLISEWKKILFNFVPAELSQMDIFARKIDFRPENNYFKNNMVKDLE